MKKLTGEQTSTVNKEQVKTPTVCCWSALAGVTLMARRLPVSESWGVQRGRIPL